MKAKSNKQAKSTKPAAKKPARKSAPKVLGYTLTSLCRGLGKAGFKVADAIKAIQRIAPKAKDVTIRTQVGKAKFGAPTLKRTEIAELRKLAKAA